MEKRIAWRKSSYSTLRGICIEFADLDNGSHAVRDSKNPAGPVLTCTTAQWVTFTAAISRGQFG